MSLKKYDADTVNVAFLSAPYFQYALPTTGHPLPSIIGDFVQRLLLTVYSFFKAEKLIAGSYAQANAAEHTLKYVESQMWALSLREATDHSNDLLRLIAFYKWLQSTPLVYEKQELFEYCLAGLTLLKSQDIDPQLKVLVYELEDIVNPKPKPLDLDLDEAKKRHSVLKAKEVHELLQRQTKRKVNLPTNTSKVTLLSILQEEYGRRKPEADSVLSVAKLREKGQKSNSVFTSIYKDSSRYRPLAKNSHSTNIFELETPVQARRNSILLENLDSLKILASGKWQDEPSRLRGIRRNIDRSKTSLTVKFKETREVHDNEDYSPPHSSALSDDEEALKKKLEDQKLAALRQLSAINDSVVVVRVPQTTRPKPKTSRPIGRR
jgi:hypothetical protein